MKKWSVKFGAWVGAAGGSLIGAVQFTFYSLTTDYMPTYMPLIFWGLFFGSVINAWRTRPGEPTKDTHKQCPQCMELVLKEAKICKHCKSSFS